MPITHHVVVASRAFPFLFATKIMNTPQRSLFTAGGLPLLIGSLPVGDPLVALQEWILTATPQIPIWPQLPTNPYEHMLHQFAEGLPGVVEESIETSDSRIYYDT
jgi:hypothetical protein